MNWYKIAQQGLLFYPWGGRYNKQRVDPISYDQNQQPIYQCHYCKSEIREPDENVLWYTDESLYRQYDVKFNTEEVKKGLLGIRQYLLPIYENFKQDVERILRDEELDEWELRMRYGRLEYQCPQLPDIINQYSSLQDFASYIQGHYGDGTMMSLIRKQPMEIDGGSLNRIENFLQNPETEINKISTYLQDSEQISIPLMAPICPDCSEDLEKCESCNEVILQGEKYYSPDEQSIYCQKCVDQGMVDVCGHCGFVSYSDDMVFSSNYGLVCRECIYEISGDYKEWANETIKEIDTPTGSSLPFSKQELSSLYNFTNKYIEKYGDRIFYDKEWGRFNYLARKARLPEICFNFLEEFARIKELEDKEGETFYATPRVLLEDLSDIIDSQKYIEQKYPQIKNYIDIPYDIDIEDNYDMSVLGFTVTITPSKEFFEYAQNKFEDIDVYKAWNIMSGTPHHPGTLAYARCGFDENTLVVNNLQRDADSDFLLDKGYGTEYLEFAKWMDKSTKYWDVFLLDIIKSMCKKRNIEGYLTTFDQQKARWGRLPIHKARKTYEKVPKLMGFDLEESDADYITECPVSIDGEMYRIADLLKKIRKKI